MPNLRARCRCGTIYLRIPCIDARYVNDVWAYSPAWISVCPRCCVGLPGGLLACKK